jgi:hypothetical protein
MNGGFDKAPLTVSNPSLSNPPIGKEKRIRVIAVGAL